MNEILFHKLYFINEIFEQKSKTQQKEMNNISRGQGRIIAILKRKDNISTKNLAIILGISVSALNSLLTKLEKKGLIVKETSMEDKRVLLIKLTEKGHNYEIKPSSVDYNLFDCLEENQKEEFDKYLNTIIHELLNNIKQENPEKFEKMTQKRNQLIQELFEKNKEEMFWFDMIEEK